MMFAENGVLSWAFATTVTKLLLATDTSRSKLTYSAVTVKYASPYSKERLIVLVLKDKEVRKALEMIETLEMIERKEIVLNRTSCYSSKQSSQ